MENIMAKKLEWYIAKFGIEDGTKRHTKIRENIGKSSKGRNTVEGFIKRYGKEEGTRKFNEFSKKSSHTKELYIERFGLDEGKKKWDEFVNKKTLSSIRRKEYWIEKGYSDQEAVKQIKLLQDNGSLKHYEKKYGDNGLEKYLEKNKTHSFNISLVGFIERYGEDEGSTRHSQYCKDRGMTFDDLVQKHGLSKANEIIDSKRQTLENYIKRLGEKEGTEKYLKYISTRSNYVSKESIAYLLPFYKIARHYGIKREDIYIGTSGSKEWHIRDGKKIYFYDFCIPSIKLIIEYNGSHIHPHLKLTEEQRENWAHAYSKRTFNECLEYDNNKNKIAAIAGFTVFQVWDFEKDNNDIREKISDFIKK